MTLMSKSKSSNAKLSGGSAKRSGSASSSENVKPDQTDLSKSSPAKSSSKSSKGKARNVKTNSKPGTKADKSAKTAAKPKAAKSVAKPKATKTVVKPNATKSAAKHKATKSVAKSTNSAAKSKTASAVPPNAPEQEKHRLTKVKNGWVPSGETVVIAERKIPGMVYIFDSTTVGKDDRRLKSKVYIDTSKLVGGRDRKGFVLHTMHYQLMEPANRASYLDWLATGKSDTEFHPHYPNIYIYGLERRLLYDKTSKQEIQNITNELVRLKSVLKDEHLLVREIQKILNISELLRNSYNSKLINFPNDHLNFKPKLLIDIGNSIAKGENLTAEQLLDWYVESPNPKVDKKALRNRSFRNKFVEVFYSQFDHGFAVKSPGVFVKLEYRAMSGEFKIVEPVLHDDQPILDIRVLTEPLNVAKEITKKILRKNKSTTIVPCHDSNFITLGVLAKKPKNKWTSAQIKKFKTLKEWASQLAEEETEFVAKDVAVGVLLESVGRISMYNWDKTVAVFSKLGFGITPDTMLYLGPPQNDDKVTIYDPNSESGAEIEHSPNYVAAMVQLGISSYMLHELNLEVEASKSKLLQFVFENSELSNGERAGLMANIDFLLQTAPDRSYLSRLRQYISSDLGDFFRQGIIEFVKGKDQLAAKTVSVVEKIYDTISLDPMLAYSDLHAAETMSSSASRMKNGGPANELDEKRVEIIKSDTEKVSKLLGDIFQVEDNAQDSQNGVATAPQELERQITVNGLDSKHTEFLGQIVKKEFWTEDAFSMLAKKHGLLPVGAVETINEWIYERFDETLLDEHEGFYVAANIAKTLKTEIKKGLM